MSIYGYARVSSKEQNLDRQISALKEYVEENNIIVDKASGKNLERPGYQALKGRLGLRRGDILYIKSLDRLSRNKIEMKAEIQWFKENGIRLKVLDLPTTMIDVDKEQSWILDMVSNILIEVLASIAEQERITIRKRQQEGIEIAKRKGKHLGRPSAELPDTFSEVMDDWKAGKITAVYAQKKLNMSSSTFYRYAAKSDSDSCQSDNDEA